MSVMAAFAPEIITQIGPLPITNTLLHTIVVDGLLIGAAYYISKNIKAKPKGFQNLVEVLLETIYNLTDSIATSKKAVQQIFPFVMTFFLFIFVSNFTGLLPGVGTIGFFDSKTEHAQVIKQTHAAETHDENFTHETAGEGKPAANTAEQNATEESAHEEEGFRPLLRAPTSDINVTLALAIISVIATHVLSIRITGLKDYISRYISLNPINLYVGLLELVAELTKVVSLSFRLFGNIVAGEIALHTISSLFAFIAPLPFLLLESIVSIVQALVFSILTLVFMAVLTTPHHAHEEAHTNSSDH